MKASPVTYDIADPLLAKSHRYRWVLLAAIFGIGLALRLWGIGWGLPSRPELHPDEHDYVMNYALKLSWAHPDPGFLNYPSFIMYLVALVAGFFRYVGLLTADWGAFLIGRCIVALFGAGTCLAVYLLVKEVKGGTVAALIAALWTALLPLSIWESHTVTTDSLMTFWTVMALWGAVRLVHSARYRDFALAGVLLGLATGSKYTAALAIVAIPTAGLLARQPARQLIFGFMVAGIASLVAIYCVAPFSLLRFNDLLRAMHYESLHTQSHHFGFSLPVPGWQYHRFRYQLVAAWPFSMGVALYACAAAGTVWFCGHLDRRRLPLLVFFVVFAVVVLRWHYVPLRYYLPLLVLGCCFAGLWQGEWLTSLQRWRRVVAVLTLLGCGIYTVLFSWQTAARWAHETRVVAGRWLDETLPKGGTMLMLGWHRYGAMPSDRGLKTVYYTHQEEPIFQLRSQDAYDLIQITSLQYARHYREHDAVVVAAYDRLRDPKGNFVLVKRFESSFINKRFYEKLDPMFGGYFVSPTLEFYRAKHSQGVVPSEEAAVHRH